MRYLIYCLFRKEQICETGLCPHAKDGEEHGAECERTKLLEALDSSAGWLVRRAFELDRARHAGYSLTFDSVTCEEYEAHLILIEESARYEAEKMPNAPALPAGSQAGAL